MDCNENSAEENEIISSAKKAHIMGCLECFATFAHVIYAGSQDYAFMLIVMQSMEDIIKNGEWIKNAQDQDHVGADDVYGVKGMVLF